LIAYDIQSASIPAKRGENTVSYIALYREWRPTAFRDVVEQEHVVNTLRYSVATNRIAHAYLFCGTRGTGKTTMAHILSRAVNCPNQKDGEPCNECEMCLEILSGSCADVLEIDAASNNSVDNVRQIRDEVIYTPTKAKRKVYIIDEVHMLSTGAFNALLKTLEEPPEHVMFILATTEPNKLPATILSRCQRFDFRRISQDGIAKQIIKIADSCGVSVAQDAARLIARMSDGAMRDAISLLDQCISLGKSQISYDDVLSVVGIVNDEFMMDFVDTLLNKNITQALDCVSLLIADGRDIAHFVSDVVLYFRNLLICNVTKGQCEGLVDVPSDVLKKMTTQAKNISADSITNYIIELSALETSLKWASNPRILLEVTLIKLCEGLLTSDRNLSDRVSALEKKLDAVAAGAAFGGSLPGGTQAREPGFAAESPAVKGFGSAPGSLSEKDLGFAPGSSAANAFGFASGNPAPEGQAPVSSVSEGYASGGQLAGSESTVSQTAGGHTSGSPAPAGLTMEGLASGSPASEYPAFEKWPKIMNHLKSLGRRTIHSLLLNAKAISIDSETIGIVFAPGEAFLRTQASKPEHIEIIKEAVLRITGREMNIKCLDEESIISSPGSAKPEQKNPLLDKAGSIAKRAGLPLEVIDE